MLKFGIYEQIKGMMISRFQVPFALVNDHSERLSFVQRQLEPAELFGAGITAGSALSKPSSCRLLDASSAH